MSYPISFPNDAYSLTAVKKAAYRFSDRLSIEIIPGERETKCVCRFLGTCSEDDAQRVLDAFRTEVLDHDLRLAIAKETEPTRNAILAYAFSKTGLQGSE
ncbi:MAG: His-Xaa-Ser system protein HxsD [Rhizomicrobium sp.]